MNSNKLPRALALLFFITSFLTAVMPMHTAVAADDAITHITDLAAPNTTLFYVDFWASWCSPCAASFPWMEKIHKKYKGKGLKIIAVNIDEESADRDAFLAKYKPSFAILTDDERLNLASSFKVANLPVSFIIDRSGKILARHNGFTLRKSSKVEKEIATLLLTVSSNAK